MAKKKVLVSFNLGIAGSTGKIMRNVSNHAVERGFDVYQVYPQNEKKSKILQGDIIISSVFLKKINQRLARYTGLNGATAYFTTKRLLKKLKKTNPSIFHFHNLHNSYVNLPLLFKFAQKRKIPIVWTLHDCWAFTGCCTHFTFVKCDKWKVLCNNCLQYKCYPESSFDNSKMMFKLKQKWFNGANITLVTPSEWLKKLVGQSFLRNYPVQVINNGIDLSIFKPVKNNFREKYGIDNDKFIVLSVAFGWGKKKGLDVMIELSKRLPEKYQIVLVGTSETVDEQLPNNIISIHRTYSQTELAEIYSSADILVNPTREDNFPTVNIESLACGTPVLTYDTGGSPEIIDDKTGTVVACEDFDALFKEIIRICEEKPYTQAACLERAKLYDMNVKFNEYISLFEKILVDNQKG